MAGWFSMRCRDVLFWEQRKSGCWLVEGEEWVKLQESFLARASAGTLPSLACFLGLFKGPAFVLSFCMGLCWGRGAVWTMVAG